MPDPQAGIGGEGGVGTLPPGTKVAADFFAANPATALAASVALPNQANLSVGAISNMQVFSNGRPLFGNGLVSFGLTTSGPINTPFGDLQVQTKGHADVHIGHEAASNSAQLVTITGSPTGGTFTMTYGGVTTSPLAYNISGAALQTALQALSSLSLWTVYVYSATGGAPPAGGPWTVSISDTDPNNPPGPFTANGAGLTGGSSPSVTISQTVPDGAIFLDSPLKAGSGGAIAVASGPVTIPNNVAVQLTDTGGTPRDVFKAAVDNTVRLGWQTAPTNNGHLIFYANGSEVARFTPGGSFAIAAGVTGGLSVAAGGLTVSAGGATVTGAMSGANPAATNDADFTTLTTNAGTDGTLGPLSLSDIVHPSATAGNRFVALRVGDSLAFRTLKLNDSGGAVLVGSASAAIGFYGGAGAAKQTVTGSKGANAALTSLMTALSAIGLVTDSTT